MPQDRQIWLAVLTFGSLVWVAAVVGILVPDMGAVLLTAFPRPEWIPEAWVRVAMAAIALVLPAVLGGVTLLLFDPEDRPRGVALLAQVARGYLLVPALAATPERRMPLRASGHSPSRCSTGDVCSSPSRPRLELRDAREPVPPADRPERRLDLGAVIGLALAVLGWRSRSWPPSLPAAAARDATRHGSASAGSSAHAWR